jgi:hypothetical protein
MGDVFLPLVLRVIWEVHGLDAWRPVRLERTDPALID